MPEDNAINRITDSYYQLTTSEKKLANFVVANGPSAQQMSISEMAAECGVAEATISRFCRRLGYSGYSAFKLAIAGATGRSAPSPLNGEILAERLRSQGHEIPGEHIINVGAAIGSHIGPNACGLVYVAENG